MSTPADCNLVDQLNGRLALALEAARQAGLITLEYFRRGWLAVERKADDSPVTAADREAEQHLRQCIAQAYPHDAIIGEEFPQQPGTTGYTWILDPIDGTKSFIHGVPLYGTLIGVEYQGHTAAGVIHIPALKETVYAARGQGAWYQHDDQPPQPARVSQTNRLSEGLFLTSEVENFYRTGRRGAYERLQAASRLSRSWGDCYGYMLVATGRAEVMVDPIAAVWDLAALAPIIEEAGGRFGDWQGRPTIYSGEAVATNALVFDEVLALLSGDDSAQ